MKERGREGKGETRKDDNNEEKIKEEGEDKGRRRAEGK